MIKYKYAKDKDGRLLYINSLHSDKREKSKFFCVGCGNELIAILGKIKIHHFAHKKVVTCSGETYLHLLGKQLFIDNFTQCLKNNQPFYIEIYQKRTCNHYEKEFGLTCKLKRVVAKFNLTQFFNKITLETREDSFIPDVMLTSKTGKDKVFIEIAVTHFSDETKLSSDYRIIELEIEEEADFEPIKRKFLSVKNSKVKFKNFKTNELNGSLCNGNSEVSYNFFTLDNEGRSVLTQRNLKQISQKLHQAKEKIMKHYITKDDSSDYPEIFKSGVANCAKEKLKVKNCFICRYHSQNNSWQYLEDTSGVPIFCKFLKIKCNSNQAVSCGYFKIETNYVEELYTNGQEMLKEREAYSNQEIDGNNFDEDEDL